MAGGHGSPQDFQYAVDPELMDETSWINPQVEQYSHHGQFLPQPGYQQFATPIPQYSSYGTTHQTHQNHQINETHQTHQTHQSPYTQQSPYANQFGRQENVDNFILSQQYGMNYPQAPSTPQPQQPSNNEIFPYPNSGPAGSTISPQALQRQRVEVVIPQGQPIGGLPNASSRSASIPNAGSGYLQGWADNIAGDSHGHAINAQTGSYSQPSNIYQDIVNYPSLTTAIPAITGARQPSGGPLQTRDSSQIPVAQNNQRSVARPSLRVTHSDLLSSVGNVLFQKPTNAPYIFIDDVPEEFQFGGKCK